MNKLTVLVCLMMLATCISAEEKTLLQIWSGNEYYAIFDAVIQAASTRPTLTENDNKLVKFCEHMKGKRSASEVFQLVRDTKTDSEIAKPVYSIMLPHLYTKLAGTEKDECLAILKSAADDGVFVIDYYKALKADNWYDERIYPYYAEREYWNLHKYLSVVTIDSTVVYNDLLSRLQTMKNPDASYLAGIFDVMIANSKNIDLDKLKQDIIRLNIKYTSLLADNEERWTPLVTKIRLILSAM